MELPHRLRHDIVAFLTGLPNVQDSASQRAFVVTAGLDAQLESQIGFDHPAAQFFALLVDALLAYGKLTDDRHALIAVLAAAKHYIGQDKQVTADALIQDCEQEFGQQFARGVAAEVRKAGIPYPIEIPTQDFLAMPEKLWERYEKLALIGRGGLSEVYQVRNRRVHSTVALKLLRAEYRYDLNTITRFWAEGKIIGLFGSAADAHTVKIHNMGRSADHEFFIEMDYVPGQTLDQKLAAEGALPAAQVVRLLRQLAIALQQAHAHHIIHRDIKPQNMIVDAGGNLTLMDFGIAKRLDSDSVVSHSGMFYGTYAYAAPEQFDPEQFGAISERTDIYALGILGYQSLTDNLPFEGNTLMQSARAHCDKPFPALPAALNIPADLAALICKCTQKPQTARFQRMTEVLAALDAMLRAAEERQACEEYRELVRSYSLPITREQRQFLDKTRLKLGLSPKLAEQVEREVAALQEPTPGPSQEGKQVFQAEKEYSPPGRGRGGSSLKTALKWTLAASAFVLLVLAGIVWRDDIEHWVKVTPTPTSPPPDDCWANPVKGKVCALTLDQAQKVTMELVWIESGCFQMGCLAGDKECSNDETPAHKVCLEGFWMGKYEVTQAQWQAVMGTNPSNFKGANRPVETVSWDDAQVFLKNFRSLADFGSLTVRLPTEAEWEYACRAGTQTVYSFGNDPGKLGDYAWYGENSNSQTHPVGQKRPNPWGLYDMHGNVWEWCADTYFDSYQNAPIDGSMRGNLGDGKTKLLRGGSWFTLPDDVRSANRGNSSPAFHSYSLGLRLVVVGARTP